MKVADCEEIVGFIYKGMMGFLEMIYCFIIEKQISLFYTKIKGGGLS